MDVFGVATLTLCTLTAIATYNDIKKIERVKNFSKHCSIIQNGKSLLYATQCIPSAQGILVISSIFMCYMHSMQITLGMSGLTTIYRDFKLRAFLVTGFLSIDTYLTVIGFMSGWYFTHKELSALKIIVQRIMQYIPIFLYILIFILSINNFDGLDGFFQFETANCKAYWISMLLFIQNYVNPSDRCMSATWIVTVGFHIMLITPLILKLLRSSGRRLRLLLMALMLFSTYIPGIITHIQSKSLDPLYAETAARSFPYLAGLFCYCEFSRIKEVSLMTKIIVWIFTFVILAIQPFLILNTSVAAIDLLPLFWLARTFNPFAICWLMHASNNGWSELVNKILSNKFSVPFANIALGVVLINDHVAHYIAIWTMQQIQGSSPNSKIATMFVATYIVSAFCATVIHLLVELPFTKLTSCLISSEIKKPENISRPQTDPYDQFL